MCSFSLRVLALMLSMFFMSCVPVYSGEYEDDLDLRAEVLFPNIPLKGDKYTVNPAVETDGFLTRAIISSDYGDFPAVGPGMLQVVLQEIEALAKLEVFEASEEFKRGAKESAEDKWESLKTIADHPQETLEGIGEGVGRFFKRVARSTKTGVQKVDDVLHDRVPGSTGEVDGAKLPGRPVGEATSTPKSKYIIAAQASGDVAINILGFADARRKLAKRLQVDPYTTNAVLSEKLDEVTWSIFAGDLGVDIATSMIPGGTLISGSTMVTNWIWDTPPGDLRVKIEKDLLAMGISQGVVDRLLRHYYYSLTMQAAVSFYLEKMDNVRGRAEVMDLLLSVVSVDQARFAVGTLMMLSRYHQEVHPLQSLEVAGTVIGHIDGGKVVIPAPVDYLSWSAGLNNFADRDEFSGKDITLYAAGFVTDRATAMLHKRGWGIHQRSDLFGIKK